MSHKLGALILEFMVLLLLTIEMLGVIISMAISTNTIMIVST